MSLRRRMQLIRTDESGFAIIIAVALMTLVTIISIGLMTLAQGEDSHSRRDFVVDNSYQAAEAGTNVYLSDLTEATGAAFSTSYVAKGEATRWDPGNVAHPNDCSTLVNGVPTCNDVAWSSGKWTYKTPLASDVGWYTMPGTGYQYLIQITAPDTTLSGLAAVITRIDVIGRPTGSTDVSKWQTIETQIRPSSLADFQAFTATDLSYASGATTTGPIFVGESTTHVKGNLSHAGTAKANLYAEGNVTVTGTLANGAQKYDQNTNPTALCKLNNCAAVPFTNFATTFTDVSGAASAGGISLAATDNTNAALSSQGYAVDAWKLVFQSNGTVLVSSCKKYSTGGSTPTIYDDYDGTSAQAPVCGTATTKTVPSNGAIYSAVDVLISGVVKGKVTVATAGDVIFSGQTTYNTAGVDVLGVEAQGSVIVAMYAPGSGHNLTIYAAMFSLSGPFEQDPDSDNCSATGTFNFYGSTAVYGLNGTKVCGSNITSSIVFSSMFSARFYNYDPNLLFVQPPFWPNLGNAFTILTQRRV